MKDCATCKHANPGSSLYIPCGKCDVIGGTEDNYSPIRLETTGHEMSSERSVSD